MPSLNRMVIGDIDLLAGSREVYCDGKLVALTGLEFNLLRLLMKNHPQLVSRENIALHIFNRNLSETNSSINMHISRIRKKLLAHTEQLGIQAFRGKGYVLLNK